MPMYPLYKHRNWIRFVIKATKNNLAIRSWQSCPSFQICTSREFFLIRNYMFRELISILFFTKLNFTLGTVLLFLCPKFFSFIEWLFPFVLVVFSEKITWCYLPHPSLERETSCNCWGNIKYSTVHTGTSTVWWFFLFFAK